MSQFCIYITVPTYLDQWLRHEYWNEESKRVEFPRGSAPRAVLQSCLTKIPKSELFTHPDPESLPIEVPSFKGINPKVYRYLPDRGRKALVSCLKRYFAAVVWKELHPLLFADVQITDIVYAFLERHGIEQTPQNWETVRQMFYRMRKKTAKSDVQTESEDNDVNVC